MTKASSVDRWQPSRVCLGLLAALLAVACEGAPRPTHGVDVVTTSSAVAEPPVAGHEARGVPVATSSSSTPLAVPPPLPRCKATGREQAVSIGRGPNERLQMDAGNGYVYLLSYLEQMARVRWSRISRSGGKLEQIAEVTRLGAPSELAAREGAAYYTQAGVLFKLGPEIGASQRLSENAHSPPALHEDRLFFIECDKRGKADYVKELSVAGGPAKTLAELIHPPGKRCDYPSVVADERDVIVGDWNAQRVVAVSREDGSHRTLIAKRGFPQSLIVEDDAVTLLSSRGLERVARDGDARLVLLDSDHVAAPFSHVILRGGEYWAADWIAYMPVDHLFRLPYGGGKPQVLASFTQSSPVDSSPHDDFLSGFAVDDECVYWARTRSQGKVELFARAK